MKYHAIIQAVRGTPWAILPEKLEEIRAFLRLKANGKKMRKRELLALTGSRRPDGVQMVGRIALLPVFGTIAQRVSLLGEASGGVSTEAIGARLDSLVADREVKAVVMVFDSPGGSVFGVQELGAKIRAYRDDKKIVGIADSMAASAAYWLASQTSELNVTPGGMVGSIGVLMAHEDWSKADEQAGVKHTLITSSPYKAEGSDTAPLSDEALGEMQKMVNHYHGLFVEAVAKGRATTENKVNTNFGQGRLVTAQEAVERGMVDKVATLETVLRRLGAGSETAIAGASLQQVKARARAVEVAIAP